MPRKYYYYDFKFIKLHPDIGTEHHMIFKALNWSNAWRRACKYASDCVYEGLHVYEPLYCTMRTHR